ncbi:uncharacterized protein HMPREF1541_07565 [Cyphellophora europaea CBS 101466]|uniref:Ubiquitin 3 binding protein But2 C-terminal domain-containing protein n=1 Tax=Cyphellophora europaea (strain CBS 101466) TaxID=1220924 RepID=W2RNB7_CYPE1|nr:uncharacterized protein HMPREF1541_07565 [Cyphellophora europaea CBS 101466]ETN37942.1 hypothetical protein HMPREF1541_07565 [Cyphellophora europaea CBS 101466]
MKVAIVALVVATSACLVSLAAAASQFLGDFLISNLVVDAPFQAYPNSTASSFVWFDFSDQDTLHVNPTRCIVEWAVGITSENGTATCANNTFTVQIPDTTYYGIQNFSIDLSHTYLDNTVGDPPYNVLTKLGGLNITFPEIENYKCDLSRGHCASVADASFLAVVTAAIA